MCVCRESEETRREGAMAPINILYIYPADTHKCESESIRKHTKLFFWIKLCFLIIVYAAALFFLFIIVTLLEGWDTRPFQEERRIEVKIDV